MFDDVSEEPTTSFIGHEMEAAGFSEVWNFFATFQLSNVAKYGHGLPEDGFKGDRNM
jgi:hypothetical protein